MTFNNMNLGRKLWLSVGLVILSLLLVIAFAATRSGRRESALMFTRCNPASAKAAAIWGNFTPLVERATSSMPGIS